MKHADEVVERSLDCVHCGLCLSSCPTYRATGREQSSPRGRIYLFHNAAEGRLPLDAVASEAGLCLGCRACETACPSGVRFGRILELVRADVADAGLRRDLAARLERMALRSVVHSLRGWPTPYGACVQGRKGLFDADGRCTDAEIEGQLRLVGAQVVEFARRRADAA